MNARFWNLLCAAAVVGSADAGGADGATSQTLRIAAVQMRSSRDLAENVARIGKALDGCAEQDTLTADLDPSRATRDNAKGSVSRGPLLEWWQSGLQRVRIIE